MHPPGGQKSRAQCVHIQRAGLQYRKVGSIPAKVSLTVLETSLTEQPEPILGIPSGPAPRILHGYYVESPQFYWPSHRIVCINNKSRETLPRALSEPSGHDILAWPKQTIQPAVIIFPPQALIRTFGLLIVNGLKNSPVNYS